MLGNNTQRQVHGGQQFYQSFPIILQNSNKCSTGLQRVCALIYTH